MDDRGTWKVGLIALLAVVGIFAMMAFLVPGVRAKLTGGRWNFYIVFDDVGGLQPSEQVVLAGVPIGNVDTVELISNRSSPGARLVEDYLFEHHLPLHNLPFALVKVNVEKKFQGQLYNYYSYQVGASSLIGSTHEVTIGPSSAPTIGGDEANAVLNNDVVIGTAAASLADLAQPASKMLGAVSDLTQKMQELVGDPKFKQQLIGTLQEVHDAANNLNEVTQQARVLTANASTALNQTFPRVNRGMYNLEVSTANLHAATARLPGMVDQVQGSLSQVRGNLVTASQHADLAVQNINAATGKIRTFVTNSGTLDQLHDTVANFNRGSQELTGVLGSLHTLATSPGIQQDLPQILHNMKDASAELKPTLSQAKETLNTFQSVGKNANSVLGAVGGILPHKTTEAGTPTAPKQPPPARQTIGLHQGIGVLYSSQTSNRFRNAGIVDPELRIDWGRSSYYLGLYDIGGQNRITAEVGHQLLGDRNRGLGLDYGLYRGYAGLGVDWVINPKLGIYAKAYDPNRPTVDLESVLDLNNNYGLWFGLDELNRRPRPVVGIRLLGFSTK